MAKKRSHATTTVEMIVRQILPKGSLPPPVRSRSDKWAVCPEWAPDLFAVTATLVEATGCFIQSRQVGGSRSSHRSYLKDIAAAAKAWDKSFRQPAEVQKWWTVVWASRKSLLAQVSSDADWVGALLRLLATSDEVCAGIGWSSTKRRSTSVAKRASLAFFQIAADADDSELSGFLPYSPHSLCVLVPPDVAIVLPKAITAAVGCSVRSASHHLSLLPGRLTMLPTWHLGANGNQGNQLRLLIVPFPFYVPATSFKKGAPDDTLPDANGKYQGFFRLTPDWLNGITPEMFVDELLIPLLRAAHSENGEDIHGLIFPECAFSRTFSDQLASTLASRTTGQTLRVRFMVAGVMEEEGGVARNKALCYTFDDADVQKSVAANRQSVALGSHSKHHPWCLDVAQIRRYGLSNLFHGDRARWWEQIDVSQRRLPFFAIRDDLCMTVLICEDLARSDPAMPVVRSVGPNLVIALLMDGPQLAARWPGRYATVLADDPGSSVLSITCAGMMDRSNANQKNPVRAIGLWRHANGDMQELILPPWRVVCSSTCNPSMRNSILWTGGRTGTVRVG
ncbi:Uncharacterised protein [Burkholderia pseudomallei]|nr:Uncharacterised protein [Burkholderia pseudomallei]